MHLLELKGRCQFQCFGSDMTDSKFITCESCGEPIGRMAYRCQYCGSFTRNYRRLIDRILIRFLVLALSMLALLVAIALID